MTPIKRQPLPDPDVIWLDADHAYRFAYSSTPEDPWGAMTYHRLEDGHWCAGVIFFKPDPKEPGRPVWTVESLKPLTISPSVLCKAPGLHGDDGMTHGFIKEDKWQPAGELPAWAKDLVDA